MHDTWHLTLICLWHWYAVRFDNWYLTSKLIDMTLCNDIGTDLPSFNWWILRQQSNASSSTILHTLQIFAIFVYFALVPSHALGASTSRAATLFIKMLLSAARLLCGYLRQQIQKCYWSQIQMMYKEKSFSTMTDSRALHLLKMAFMLLLHAVKSQIM